MQNGGKRDFLHMIVDSMFLPPPKMKNKTRLKNYPQAYPKLLRTYFFLKGRKQ